MGWFTSKAEERAEELQEAHNQGQTDASNGQHDKPYGPGHTVGGAFIGADVERMEEINDAWEQGQANHESQTKSGCFLTTACVEYAGLADDCHELTVLRSFRDNYVARLVNGASVLAEYRKVAPTLVEQIKQDADHEAVLMGVYATVAQAVELVEGGKHVEAFSCYETMFNSLKQRYHVSV
jgi:hypothetical protein